MKKGQLLLALFHALVFSSKGTEERGSAEQAVQLAIDGSDDSPEVFFALMEVVVVHVNDQQLAFGVRADPCLISSFKRFK